MCFSEIAQAQQVSPLCEIKLAAVFIDFSVKKRVQMLLGFVFFFFSVEHQVILDGFLLICHLPHVWTTGRQ